MELADNPNIHTVTQLNNRVAVFQHKAIEPLGESKSDYKIFSMICERLGLSAYFTEGISEIAWARGIFDSSDLPKIISWENFVNVFPCRFARTPYQLISTRDWLFISMDGSSTFPWRSRVTSDPHAITNVFFLSRNWCIF